MTLRTKTRFRPIFKQFIKLRENVQKRHKLLKFRKKKWELFLKVYTNKLKKFRKFKPLDHSKYFVTKYGTRGMGYGRRYRDTLQAGKRMRLLYGNLLKKYFQKKIRATLKKKKSTSKNAPHLNTVFLEYFEKRLDTVLYRSKFALTMRNARQLISHGHVSVNKKVVKNKAYTLMDGDLVSLNFNCLEAYENNTFNSVKWSIPPKHLIINYRTLEILFLNDITANNMANEFSFNLRLQKILNGYSRQ